MSNWTDTLQALGAQLSDDLHTLSTADSGDIIPLLHLSTLRVDGPDTDKFLQGQLSADMNRARKEGSTLACHCNIKGHMISLFRAIATDGGFLLRMHHELTDDAAKTLGKYIIFSKAQISRPEALVGIGLIGDNAEALAAKAVSQPPATDNQITREGELTLVRVPGNRFELWLPAADAIALLPQLLENGTLGSSNDWLLSEIRAGIPDLRTNTREAFIPQMTNLQALEGVSFTKGCYTGQEIVTRLQHRGQLKRPMYRLRAQSDTLPEPGSAIHSSDKENAGQVVIAAQDGDHVELLAVILKEQADTTTLHLFSCDGPAASVESLPYTLDPKLFEPKNRL